MNNCKIKINDCKIKINSCKIKMNNCKIKVNNEIEIFIKILNCLKIHLV